MGESLLFMFNLSPNCQSCCLQRGGRGGGLGGGEKEETKPWHRGEEKIKTFYIYRCTHGSAHGNSKRGSYHVMTSHCRVRLAACYWSRTFKRTFLVWKYLCQDALHRSQRYGNIRKTVFMLRYFRQFLTNTTPFNENTVQSSSEFITAEDLECLLQRLDLFLAMTIATTSTTTKPRMTMMTATKTMTITMQRLDVFLATCNPVFVADARVNTRWLKLFIVIKRGSELLLGALQVALLFRHGFRLVLFSLGLVLNVLGFLGFVNFRICHELIVFLLCGFFGSLVRLKQLLETLQTTTSQTLLWLF